MKETHSRPTTSCIWCKEVMIQGRGPEKTITLPATCCDCRAKYFPCIGEGSECQYEFLSREEVEDSEPIAMGSAGNVTSVVTMSHYDTHKCVVCKREIDLEPEPCDCHSGE